MATARLMSDRRKALALKLPDGDVGTDCTIMAMRAMAEHAAGMAVVQTLAEQIARSPTGEAFPEALYQWLANNRRFKRDPRGLEHVRHPALIVEAIDRAATLRKQVGVDCDDVATLAVSLLLARFEALSKSEPRDAALIPRPCFVVLAKLPPPAPFAHVFYGTWRTAMAGSVPLHLPDGIAPSNSFTPWDPQEHKRVPMRQMHKGTRFRVYPL